MRRRVTLIEQLLRHLRRFYEDISPRKRVKTSRSLAIETRERALSQLCLPRTICTLHPPVISNRT